MYTYQTINKNSVSRKPVISAISCTKSNPSYSSTTTYIPSHTSYSNDAIKYTYNNYTTYSNEPTKYTYNNYTTYSNDPTKYTYNNYKSVTPRINVEYYSSHPKYVTSNIRTVYSETPRYESHYNPLKFSNFESPQSNVRFSDKSDSYSKNINNLSPINKGSSINSLETLESSFSYDYLMPKMKAFNYEGEQKKFDNDTNSNQDNINFETATKNELFKYIKSNTIKDNHNQNELLIQNPMKHEIISDLKGEKN